MNMVPLRLVYPKSPFARLNFGRKLTVLNSGRTSRKIKESYKDQNLKKNQFPERNMNTVFFVLFFYYF